MDQPTPPPRDRTQRLAAAGVAVVALVYIVWIAELPSDTFWAGDMGVKRVQVESLVRSRWRTFALDYPGRAIDPEGRYLPLSSLFAARLDGRWYGVFPPFFPFLTSLLYAVLGSVGLNVLPAAAGVATLGLALKLARRMDLGEHAIYLPVVLGIGSPLFLYSIVFWEHTLAVALCLSGFLLAAPTQRPGGRIAAGALMGLACVFRPECYWFLAAVCTATVIAGPPRAWRRAAPMAAAALAVCAAMWAFNAAQFGHPLGLHYLLNKQHRFGEAASWAARVKQAGANAAHLLINPGGADRVVNTWMLIPLGIFAAACWTRVGKLVVAAGALAVVSLVALAVLVASHFVMEGLFAVSPMCIFCIAAAPRLWRSRDVLARRMMLAAPVFVAGVLATSPTAGGWQYGPRLLLPALPLLVLLSIKGMMLLREHAPPRTVVLVFFCCVCVGGIGAFRAVNVVYRTKADWRLLKQAFDASPSQVIVTDQQYVPQNLAALWYRKPFFLLPPSGRDATDLVDRLAGTGIERFLFVSNQPELQFDASRAQRVRSLRAGEVRTFRVTELVFREYEIVR